MYLQQKNKGFSLIELMVTIAIVGVLASIAIPTYSNYLKRAKMANMYAYIQQAQVIIADYIANTGDTTCTNLANPALPASLDSFYYGVTNCNIEVSGLVSDFGFSPHLSYLANANYNPSGVTVSWVCYYWPLNTPNDGVDYNAIMQTMVPKGCTTT